MEVSPSKKDLERYDEIGGRKKRIKQKKRKGKIMMKGSN